MNSGPVNHEGYFRFYPREIGSVNTLYGYYFAIDVTDDFKPSSLEDRYSNNNCHSSYFNYCLAFPDINYLVFHVKTSTNYYTLMYVNFGPAISQVTTNMVAKVWAEQRYKGTQTLQITSTCWN